MSGRIIRPGFFDPSRKKPVEIIGAGPKQCIPIKEVGTVTIVDRDTGCIIGKQFNTNGLMRVLASLIRDKCGGMLTVAAKDIEEMEPTQIFFDYTKEMDIFDIAVAAAGEPNPFEHSSDETEDNEEGNKYEQG